MSMVNRREFLKRIGASVGPAMVSMPGLLGAAARAATGGKSERKPNIIFILADDLGYGDIGCYGQKMIRTSIIDKMAREGMRFTDCYAGSTVCAPSRCVLMTGKHTGHCFIRGNQKVALPTEEVTVAELLKQAGYRTGIVGKWGLGDPGTMGTPNKKGFDYSFGYLNQTLAHDYYPKTLFRNDEEVAVPEGSYSHDLFTQEALDFVTREKDNPFFLYLAYTIPHAHNEEFRAGRQAMQVPSAYPYTGEEWPETERNKAAMITRMDRDIGRLMRLLEDLKLDDDTIVFFTSDNGPHTEGGVKPEFFNSSGGLRGIKRDLYEGGVRVPMVVRWPGKIKPGQVSDQVWAFWDFLPTACEIAGTKPNDGTDGISMLPALTGHDQKDHEYLYWEFHERCFAQAIRLGKWKAVRNDKDKPIELYDLASDLGETNDVAARHPEVIERVEDILKNARTHSEYWPWPEEPPSPPVGSAGDA